MTTPREPESIIAAWLEEGPDRLLETTRRAITVTTRTTHQTRRAIRVPWRTPPMNPFPRLAIALATIVVAVGGAILVLSPGNQGVGGPPPVASPAVSAPPATPAPTTTPGPSPSPSLAWQTFVSERFGYGVDLPGEWTISSLIDDLPDDLYPGGETAYGDRWDLPVTRVPWLIIAVRDPEPDETLDFWMARYTADLEDACDASEAVPAEIDGQAGTIRAPACMSGVAATEALVAHNGRAYTITLSGRSQEVDALRATFDAIVASFHFVD